MADAPHGAAVSPLPVKAAPSALKEVVPVPPPRQHGLRRPGGAHRDDGGDGVNVPSLALLVVVTWRLTRVALVDLPTAALAVSAAVLLARVRVNSVWLVLGGALVGLTAHGSR